MLDLGLEPYPATVSRETAARLTRFCGLIAAWNARIRLVGAPTQAALSKHMRASLTLLPWVPLTARRFADLGSGQGFPGMVVALVTNVPGVLIEADRRKAAFLRHAAMELQAPVTIRCERIECAPPQNADFVTARALATAETLMRFGTRHAAPSGVCAFLKGPGLAAELARADTTIPGAWRAIDLVSGDTLLIRGSMSQ